jgi:hypothetical protein
MAGSGVIRHLGEDGDDDPPRTRARRGRGMIGLFFEVIPLEGHPSRYFKLAAALRPE